MGVWGHPEGRAVARFQMVLLAPYLRLFVVVRGVVLIRSLLTALGPWVLGWGHVHSSFEVSPVCRVLKVRLSVSLMAVL